MSYLPVEDVVLSFCRLTAGPLTIGQRFVRVGPESPDDGSVSLLDKRSRRTLSELKQSVNEMNDEIFIGTYIVQYLETRCLPRQVEIGDHADPCRRSTAPRAGLDEASVFSTILRSAIFGY